MKRKSFARTALSALCFSLVFGQAAVAADTSLAELTAPAFAGVSVAAERPVAADGTAPRLAVPVPVTAPAPALAGHRPTALPILYASLATLNVLDAWTTKKGLSHGAVEANPFMKSVAGNSAALLAVKAGGTTMSIWMAERLWKKNRAAAIATMLAVNAVTGFVVLHNQRVISKVR